MVQKQENDSKPRKIPSNYIRQTKHKYSNETIRVDKKTVETVPSVRHLGVQLDDKLWLQTKCINPLSANPTK